MSDTFDHQYDDFDIDDEGTGFMSDRRHECKYCGDNQVRWTDTKQGWRLYSTETLTPHTCKEYKESS